MSRTELESALRIMIEHRNCRPTCVLTRSLIHRTIEAIRRLA